MKSKTIIGIALLSFLLAGCAKHLSYNAYAPDFKNPLNSHFVIVPVEAELMPWETLASDHNNLANILEQRILTGQRNGQNWIEPSMKESLDKRKIKATAVYRPTEFTKTCINMIGDFILRQTEQFSKPNEVKNLLVLSNEPIDNEVIKQCLISSDLADLKTPIIFVRFKGNINPEIFELTPVKRDPFTAYTERLKSNYFPKPNAYQVRVRSVLYNPNTKKVLGIRNSLAISRMHYGNSSHDTYTDDSLPDALAGLITSIVTDHEELRKSQQNTK